MARETKKDFIFTIIERYYSANKNLSKSGIREHLIGNGIDISEEVLKERIKYFKDETSDTNKEKSKNT